MNEIHIKISDKEKEKPVYDLYINGVWGLSRTSPENLLREIAKLSKESIKNTGEGINLTLQIESEAGISTNYGSSFGVLFK